MSSNSEVSKWKYSNFLINKNNNFNKNKILKILSSEDIDEVKNPENYCLMLATYEKRKGHIFLLNAFKEVVKEHKNIQLRIHGYGSIDDVNRVSNKVKDLNLEVNVWLTFGLMMNTYQLC